MNSYPVNPENAVEMARLLNQHALLTNAMGSLLPELHGERIARLHDVLDLACGPGGWVLDVARTFPHMQVTGVDISAIMVEFGRMTAQSQAVRNAHFLTMNLYEPLGLPDNSFDLVNGRLLSSILTRDIWSSLLHETFRVCRSGGITRLADGELPVTTSPALEQLLQILSQAYHMTGRGFSPDGKTLGVTSQLSLLLQNAGYDKVQEYARTLDFSANTPLHHGFYQDTLAAFQLLKPFFVGLQLITNVDYQQLYQQMLVETISPDFRAACDVLIAWGEKP